MHSVNIARPASPPDDPSGKHPANVPTGSGRAAIIRRPARLIVVLLATIVVLAGCASDRAYDQERAQQTAQTTHQAVVDIQASFAANRYASPTTTATPTPVPPAILHEIGLATGVSGDGEPDGMVTAVANNAGTVYVVADLEGLNGEASIGVDVYVNTREQEDFRQVDSASITVTGSGRQWVAVPYALNGGLEPREYAFFLYVDGQVIGSLGIEILSPGSASRRV